MLHRALARVIPPRWRWNLRTADDKREDSELSLKPPTGPSTTLNVEVKSRLLPAELSASLVRYQEGKWLLAAPTLGPRAREILDKAGISWLELDGGDCRINAGPLYIERLVRKQRRLMEPDTSGRRYVSDLFSGKALRIVRWLLSEPDRDWNLADMAERADVSLGLVSRVFATLVRDAYMGRRPSASRLTDAQGLIDAWASSAAPREERFERVSLEPGPAGPLVTLRQLPGRVTAPGYVLTAEAAADQLAPFARWSQVEMYVDEVQKWDQILDLQPVPRGGNVVLIGSSDRWVFDGAFRAGGLTLASRPQVYVDLRRRGGSASEAADFLRERGELWPK